MKKLRVLIISVLAVLAFGVLVSCGAPDLPKPENLKITNKTLSWDAVDNARGYTVDINGTLHDVRRTSYFFDNVRLEEGTYTFKVKARGNEVDYADSDWATITYEQGYESGLVYKLDDSGKAYVLESVGTAKGDIVIEDTHNDLPVVAVSDFAFTNNLNVKSVVIGKNVTKIGDRAFYGCSEMKSLVIPDSVTELGDMSFQSCHSLTELVIPDSVTVLGDSAFSYCRGLTKVEIGTGISVIGASAFKNCEALQSIIIPENIKIIGAEAFRGCSKLASLEIKSTILVAGDSTFYGCTALSSIDFGNCVMAISESMFANCEALTSVDIPDTVVSIGNTAFYGCVALTDISIGKNVVSVGGNVFKDTAALNDSEDKIYIIDKWIVGANNALEDPLVNKDIQNIANEDITGIADFAFMSCSALSTISLPASIRYIGKYAFTYCTNLMHVLVRDKVEIIDSYAFYGCTRLTNVQLGANIKTIGAYAFAYCENLTCAEGTINIPDKVTSIGTYAFFKTALWNETNDVLDPAEPVMYVDKWVVGCNPAVGSVEIQEGTVGVADYAFAYNESLYAVQLPSTLKYLGTGAFYRVTGYQWMLGAPPLLYINIPDSITEIKPYTFYGAGVTLLTIPDSVKKIGYAAFGGSSLMKIEIPDSVTEIEAYAFWACSDLQTVTLSKNITVIPNRAFSSCDSLESIEIPAGVTSIGERAFFRCEALESVEFKGDLVESVGDYAFYMTSALRSLDLPDSVTEIGDYAFYKSGIRYISLGSNLETIGDYAFYSCSSLIKINLPYSVTRIGNSAFRYNTRLKSVTLGRDVSEIGEHAFYGIKGLTIYSESISIPKDWSVRWNSSYRPVVLGAKLDANREYVVSVNKTDTSLYNYYAEDGISAPKRTGYVFVGWATASGATEAEYSAAEIASAPNGTLYAVWEEGEDPDEVRYNEIDEIIDELPDFLK